VIPMLPHKQTDRPPRGEDDTSPGGMPLRRAHARPSGKSLGGGTGASARLQAALAQELSHVGALDLLIAEVSPPMDWAGGVRQRDGPQVLLLVANHIGAQLEDGESLHVLGGQRFAILRLDGLDSTERRCARLLVELKRPLAGPLGRRIVPDATLGATRIDAGTTPAEGLRRGLAALQAARAEGAEMVVWHRPQVDDYLRLRRQLVRELPDALRRTQLVLLLEPTLCLHAGAVTGGRAQLRWPHPRLGTIGGAELWALARQTSTTQQLERCALPLAMQHLREGLKAGIRLPVSVQLSPSTLLEEFFVERLRDACAQSGVPTQLLRIELRHDIPWPDPEVLRWRLHELSTDGIETMIGDINRWQLALQHLLGIPLAGVECSVAWARDQLCEPRTRSALGALVRVGHALGGSVGASGADSPEDLVWLRELRFDHARGAACAPLMTPMEFLAHARDRGTSASKIDPYSI